MQSDLMELLLGAVKNLKYYCKSCLGLWGKPCSAGVFTSTSLPEYP
jgi:hypothetical protein